MRLQGLCKQEGQSGVLVTPQQALSPLSALEWQLPWATEGLPTQQLQVVLLSLPVALL